jgi:hypothetical protein
MLYIFRPLNGEWAKLWVIFKALTQHSPSNTENNYKNIAKDSKQPI